MCSSDLIDVKVRVLAQDKNDAESFTVEALEDKDYVNPVSKQQNRYKKGDHYNTQAKFLKPDVRESLDIEEVVNEALKAVRKEPTNELFGLGAKVEISDKSDKNKKVKVGSGDLVAYKPEFDNSGYARDNEGVYMIDKIKDGKVI